MLVAAFLLVLFPVIFLFHLHQHKNTGKINFPPGPPGLPLIGNLHQLDISATHIHLWHLSKKYGSLMSLRLGFVPAIVVSSAKMAEQVLKTNDLIFASRPSLIGQQKLSYNGLDLAFAPYGDYWRKMRKNCILHLFNFKRVQSFSPIREDEVYRMIKKISRAAGECKPVNLSQEAIVLTSSIICRVTLGKRYEDEGIERSRFHSLFNDAEASMVEFYFSDYFPLMGWFDKIKGKISRLEKSFKDLDTFYQEIIDQHLHSDRPKSEQEDFIDVLLRIRKERLLSMDLTLDHIKGVLMNVFIAATDTSASILIWAMSCIAKNPEAMIKVQEEIRHLMDEREFVTEEDIARLPYLKAVIKEALRLYPPTPLLIPRETTQDINIDGFDIPANTLVYVNAYAIGRDPEAWKNPEEFCPDRFLNSPIDYRGQDFGLIPFGAGRRSCPGINMGIANLELALSNLLFKFDWELPPMMKKEDVDMNPIPGITIHKKIPLCLVPKSYHYL